MVSKQQQLFQYYTFKRVECPDSNVAARIRNLFPDTWFVFQRDNELIWSYDVDVNPETVNDMDNMIESFDLSVKKVNAAQKKKLLRHIRLNKPRFIFHDQLQQLRLPVDLKHRLFWIAKPLPVGKKAELSIISELFRFKRAYEQKWCKAEPLNYTGMSYRDLTCLLFQPNDIRGRRMLDINIWDDPFWIIMRFMPYDTATSNELIMLFLDEFNQVFDQIEQLILKHLLDNTGRNETI